MSRTVATTPVKIQLHTGTGATSSLTTGHQVAFDNLIITSASAGDFCDSFDGTALDAPWLFGGNACGVPTESGGEAVLQQASGCSNVGMSMTTDQSKYVIRGDFDISVDFRLPNFSVPNPGDRIATFQLRTLSGGFYATIERYNRILGACNPSTQNYKAWFTNSLNCDASVAWTPSTATQGRFRLTRVGSLVTAWYWNGAWVALKSGTMPIVDLRLSLVAATLNGTSGYDVRFDNLTVNIDPSANPVACVDISAPLVTAPEDASYQCVAEVPAGLPEQATAMDDRGVTLVTVEESGNGGVGSELDPLVITRTWTAIDAAGNAGTDSQTITVIDDTLPGLTVPAALDLSTGPGVEMCTDVRLEVTALGTASANDNCDSVTVSVSGFPEGSLFPVGMTTLLYTATDAAGNTMTGSQTVTVRCPVGALAGSASETCNGNTAPAEGLTVRLLHEGTPFRDVLTGSDGSYSFGDVRLGTYTVQVVAPEGYAVPIDTRVVTLTEENGTVPVEVFAFTCLLADIAGTVEGTCNGSTAGLHGVTVDLFREGTGGMDVLVGSAPTDATGAYRFDDLALGEYTVAPVAPLGYSAGAPSLDVTLTQPDGLVTATAFTLTCQTITAAPRAMGYWKHQVNVYLTGKGHAQETLDQLLGYLDLLTEHFNENVVNPVIVYVPGGSTTTDKLLELQQLLTVNKGGTALDRAKRELLALLLNVVSGKIGQAHVISEDGATVSQAITYCDNLIDTVGGDYARAQAVAEYVNGGTPVPAGMIPLTTAQITYRRELALKSFHVTPNPGPGARTFQFTMGQPGRARLAVYDVSGRLVTVLADDLLNSGPQSISWNGTSGGGTSLGNGIYFARLDTDQGGRTLKLVQMDR